LDNWKDNRSVFWTLAGPGTFWLLVFFILPLGFLFVMSFSDKAVINGEVSITEYDYLTGISNYIRSLDALYLTIIWKSIWVSALATVLCLVTAYPIAFGICFASEKWKPLLSLPGICEPGIGHRGARTLRHAL
jgi:spermidine/putrescine transport system permease protein